MKYKLVSLIAFSFAFATSALAAPRKLECNLSLMDPRSEEIWHYVGSEWKNNRFTIDDSKESGSEVTVLENRNVKIVAAISPFYRIDDVPSFWVYFIDKHEQGFDGSSKKIMQVSAKLGTALHYEFDVSTIATLRGDCHLLD